MIAFLCGISQISGQVADSPLKITHLTGDFYVFTTYNMYKGSRIPANGMYLLTNAGAVLFDTPWDTTQFQPLQDSIRSRHDQQIVLCFATHFHEDRTAGLEYFRQRGARTYTTKHTDEWSRKKGMQRAEFLIEKDSVYQVGQYSFQTYFPGPGHAPDNIVIWFGKEKVLYGGCLIKSVEDNSLGNLSDANVKEYANTIRNVKRKCRKPDYIITGHNDWTNTHSLEHTLKMAKALRRKNHN
jgi:metallo-beta-lactamase class B